MYVCVCSCLHFPLIVEENEHLFKSFIFVSLKLLFIQVNAFQQNSRDIYI